MKTIRKKFISVVKPSTIVYIERQDHLDLDIALHFHEDEPSNLYIGERLRIFKWFYGEGTLIGWDLSIYSLNFSFML